MERLTKRHGNGEMAKKFTDMFIKFEQFYEPKGENEENTFDIEVTTEMTVEDVAKHVLEIINECK